MDASVPALELVTVATPDVHGALRGKTYSAEAFARIQERGVTEMTDVVFLVDAADQPIAPAPAGVSEQTGDLLVRPDSDRIYRTAWRPAHAFSLASPLWPGGEPCELSPRVLLERVLGRLAADGLTVKAAFEYELRLRHVATGAPVTASLSYSVTELARLDAFLLELRRATAGLGIELDAVHTEAGPGMLELNLAARDGMTAADEAILLRTCVRQLAAARDLEVSFMAKSTVGEEGSGGHLHLSLWDDTEANLFAGGDDLSEPFAACVAGLLAHMPAMSLVYNPTINSYKRLVPGFFAPVNATWGFDNRSAAVRAIIGDEPGRSRLELRRPGADANPYTTLAAAAASAHRGLVDGLRPPSPVAGDAAARPREDAWLPASLETALREFDSSRNTTTLLGTVFPPFFSDTRRWELSSWLRCVTDWERRRGELVP